MPLGRVTAFPQVGLVKSFKQHFLMTFAPAPTSPPQSPHPGPPRHAMQPVRDLCVLKLSGRAYWILLVAALRTGAAGSLVHRRSERVEVIRQHVAIHIGGRADLGVPEKPRRGGQRST